MNLIGKIIVVFIHQIISINAQTQCTKIVCDAVPDPTDFTSPCEYTGEIVPNQDNGNGEPILRGKTSDGIEILVACTDDTSSQESTKNINLVIPEDFKGNFSINQKREEPKVQVIQVTPEYDIVSSVEISFTIPACAPDDATLCRDVVIIINYSFNRKRPEFNEIVGIGSIKNSEACEGDDSEACKVNIENGYRASDGDNDVVVYSINPTGENAISFELMDETNLDSIYYKDGIKEQTVVQLLIEARDLRTLDSMSSFGVINIDVGTTATPAPSSSTDASTGSTPDPQCNDENKKLYFILMIVFAVLFGLTLLAAICTPIIIKLCRKDNVMSMTGPLSRKASMKTSGIVTKNALYRSFSEMNYDTASSKKSDDSSPELETRVRSSGRVIKAKKNSSNSRSLNISDDE